MFIRVLSSDTALNLAVHRQKDRVVDLLLQYHANPNIFNQAGKTALHRAVISYTDENINRIRALLDVKIEEIIERFLIDYLF
jgi:ankyrin repeat protein